MTLQSRRARSGLVVASRHLPTLFAALLMAGCGGEEWQAETAPASGRVTINGEAPTGAIIELHSVGGEPDVRNSRPWGIVQDDGSFTLQTYEAADGAPPGEYAVTIRWPPDTSQPTLADRLGGAYATPEKSQWTVTISEGEEGQNVLEPVHITDAKVQSKEAAQTPSQVPPGPGMNSDRRTRRR